MVQVLLIGGDHDGKIEEHEYKRDGVIIHYNPYSFKLALTGNRDAQPIQIYNGR